MSYTYEYERPALTVDAIIYRQRRAASGHGAENQILLIQRGIEPFKGKWALPGGHVDKYEDPERACIREVVEETGVELYKDDTSLYYVVGGEGRDPRGWVVALVYVAYAPWTTEPQAGDDAAEAQWFSTNKLPEMAFDHRGVLDRFLPGISYWEENEG